MMNLIYDSSYIRVLKELKITIAELFLYVLCGCFSMCFL